MHQVRRDPTPRTVAGLGKRHLAACHACAWTYTSTDRRARDEAAADHEARTAVTS